VSTEAPAKKNDEFDVVMMHGPTDDGAGSKVLRARPGRLEAGEVRPMADGRPLTPGGEVVHLEKRADAKGLFDVRVDYKVPEPGETNAQGRPSESDTQSHALSGPAQVATRAYRDSWERTFGMN
jgi:hypothetical protein